MKRKNFGQLEGNKFGLNFRPNEKPLQFTPTEGYQGIQNNNENYFRGDDQKLMGNPLSRYRPMPMEEPMIDIGKFSLPKSNTKFFDNRKDQTRKQEVKPTILPEQGIGEDLTTSMNVKHE